MKAHSLVFCMIIAICLNSVAILAGIQAGRFMIVNNNMWGIFYSINSGIALTFGVMFCLIVSKGLDKKSNKTETEKVGG